MYLCLNIYLKCSFDRIEHFYLFSYGATIIPITAIQCSCVFKGGVGDKGDRPPINFFLCISIHHIFIISVYDIVQAGPHKKFQTPVLKISLGP